MSDSTKRIEIVPYNSNWPIHYSKQASEIALALGDNLISIHHIGSTAVPGLCAKSKIDILVVVQYPQKSIIPLKKINIQYKGEYNIPLRYFFSKRGKNDFNIHIYKKNHPEIELNLLFRDYLLRFPEVRNEYARVKRDILLNGNMFESQNFQLSGYTLSKGHYIRKILEKAGFNALRIIKCSDKFEWKTAKKLREKYFLSLGDGFKNKDMDIKKFNHYHIILYKGARIKGYCEIELNYMKSAFINIIIVESNKHYEFLFNEFKILISKWIENIGYKITSGDV